MKYTSCKFSPIYVNNGKGAPEALKSNAASGGSIRKTPYRARAYNASSDWTNNKMGGGEK
jgi:hypothetical protein